MKLLLLIALLGVAAFAKPLDEYIDPDCIETEDDVVIEPEAELDFEPGLVDEGIKIDFDSEELEEECEDGPLEPATTVEPVETDPPDECVTDLPAPANPCDAKPCGSGCPQDCGMCPDDDRCIVETDPPPPATPEETDPTPTVSAECVDEEDGDEGNELLDVEIEAAIVEANPKILIIEDKVEDIEECEDQGEY